MGKFKSMFLCCKPCGQRGDVYEVSRAAASTPPIVSLSVKRMNNSSLRIHSRPSVECEDQIIIDKNASSPSLNSFESDDKRTESLRVSLASCPDSSGFDAQDIPSYPLAEEAAIEPDSIAQAIPTCPVPEDVTVEPKWVARDIPSYPLADEAAVKPSIAQDIPTCPLLEDVAVGPDSVAQDVPSCPLAVEVVVERDLDVPVADVTEFSDYVSTLEVIDDEENQKSTQAIKIMHNCSVMMSQYADWIHCTMCFKTPPLMGQIFFSSCGHVLCQKCGYNHDQNTTVNICPHCKAQVRCVPVDKNLSSDIKMYFRTPYDLATQFMQQLKKVLDFQSVNRQRLQKHNQEKTMKLHKYAEGAGGQLKKMQEAVKKLHQEKQQLLVEIQSCKQQIHELSQRCKIAEASLCDNARGGSDSGIGSLFSTDSSMNMSAVLTSTPIYGSSPVDPNLLNGSGGHKGVSIFGSANLSPISSDIFGGKNPPRRNSGSRPGRDFFS